MSELKFRGIELSDRRRAEELLAVSGFRGCEYTFGNNFAWRKVYNVEVCFYEGFYFCKQLGGSKTRFIYPAGEGETTRAVELAREYCRENGLPFRMLANSAVCEKVSAAFPEAEIIPLRDMYDYIYSARDLSELAGKKYHAKRNHIRRFDENEWSCELITPDNIGECAEMNERWCAENISEGDFDKLDEKSVVEESFANYGELGYHGVLIRVNGRAEAFSFGQPSSSDCFVVHVEKASREYQGAYAAINRELARSLGGKFAYINREEDMGEENLRKAKLSYYPAFMEEKNYIVFGGN